jgi:hypothetical protein
MSDVREASVETGNDRLPGGALVQTGPFLILAIGALWLRSRWDELPARLPIHWNWRVRWTATFPAASWAHRCRFCSASRSAC